MVEEDRGRVVAVVAAVGCAEAEVGEEVGLTRSGRVLGPEDLKDIVIGCVVEERVREDARRRKRLLMINVGIRQ